MAMSMLTNTIEHDPRRTGIGREEVYTAIHSFVEKFTFAMGPLIIGFAMQFAGFDRDLPDEALQSPEVGKALLLGVSYIPTAMGLLAMFILTRSRLTKAELERTEPAPS